MEYEETDLNAIANLLGLNMTMGSIMNAMKKHTAAPIRHAPKPSSLFTFRSVEVPKSFQAREENRKHKNEAQDTSESKKAQSS